jgi:hypothetical protein
MRGRLGRRMQSAGLHNGLDKALAQLASLIEVES